MSGWSVIVLSFLAGTFSALFGRLLVSGRAGSKSSSQSPQANSVVLEYLKETGIKDNKKNLEALKKYVSLGEEAEHDKVELRELRRANKVFQDEVERLQNEVDSLELESDELNVPKASESTGVAPRIQGQMSALDVLRAEARSNLMASLDVAVDGPDTSQIINLTDLFEALEKEADFPSDMAEAEVRAALDDSWIHTILRAQALIETYCPSERDGVIVALQEVAVGLKSIVRRHGLRISPIRLLVPDHTAFEETESSLADLNGIIPIRNKLRALAKATNGVQQDLPTMLIDCVVSEVTGEDGILISAEGAAFRTEDWQVGS